MKHPDWHNRLITVIRAAEKRPFLWGSHDCCLFAADCAQAMCGEDFAAGWRGTYDSERGAKKAILRGGGSLEKVLARYLDEVPVKLAQRGILPWLKMPGRDVPEWCIPALCGCLAKMVLSVCGLNR